MLNKSQINSIHIEASTYCNARCPQCPRNFNGWNILNTNEVHLNIEKLKLIVNQLPSDVMGLFNGNYGDPMMHPKITEMTKLFSNNNVIVVTNGSIGKLKTFEELAKQSVKVWFSIDGLEDTNHIYRQDVSWDKLMQRVKHFINNGGTAIWKFVIFRHNAHQVNEAETLSKKLGFKEFFVINDNRNYGPILNNNGKEIGWLLPHDEDKQPYVYDIDYELDLINNKFKLQNVYNDATINCKTLENKEIYMNVYGEILPCCFHGVNQHINSKGNTLQEMLDSFNWLKDTWGKNSCNETCYNTCKR